MKKISEEVRNRIIDDNEFSLDVAKILCVQQYSVKALVKRNSGKLANYHAVEYYKSRGYSLEQIFES